MKSNSQSARSHQKAGRTALTISVMIIAGLAFSGCDRTERDWSNSKQTNTTAAYMDFLSKHSQGAHVEEARNAIEALEWDAAKQANTVVAYKAFLSKYPEGARVEEARDAIETLQWTMTQSASKESIKALKLYLKEFPHGKHTGEAAVKLEDAEFALADGQGTPEAYFAFQAKYPETKHLRVNSGKITSSIVFLSGGGKLGLGCNVSVNGDYVGVAGGGDAVRWGLADGDGVGQLNVKEIANGQVISKKTGDNWVIVGVHGQ
jgi:hypothetical protein